MHHSDDSFSSFYFVFVPFQFCFIYLFFIYYLRVRSYLRCVLLILLKVSTSGRTLRVLVSQFSCSLIRFVVVPSWCSCSRVASPPLEIVRYLRFVSFEFSSFRFLRSVSFDVTSFISVPFFRFVRVVCVILIRLSLLLLLIFVTSCPGSHPWRSYVVVLI